jgi:hypothetical protein
VRTLIGEAEDSKKLESLKAQLPMRGQSFDDFYTEEPSMADELQSNLTVLLNLDTHVKLSPNNEQDRVRMDSLRKPNAGRPLTTLPTEPALKISNTEYTLLTKIRLADKTVKLPEFCGHCKKRFEGPNAAAHFLGCQGLMPVQGCKRHNAIVKILKKWIERAGGIATVEPRGLTAKSNDRPDIDTMLGLDSYFLDVTVLTLWLRQTSLEEKRFCNMPRHERSANIMAWDKHMVLRSFRSLWTCMVCLETRLWNSSTSWSITPTKTPAITARCKSEMG